MDVCERQLTSIDQPANPLPREIAPGIFWLGECYLIPYKDRWLHAYNASYLVVGETASAIVETSISGKAKGVVLKQLDGLRATRDIPDPEYIFVTHSEMAHAGGVGYLLDRFPGASAYGDVSDLHLVWPQFADRLHFVEPGDRFDLGGSEILVVEGVFRDLLHSRWYFDTSRATLFPGDGFAYSHYHEEGACGKLAEEVPSLDIGKGMEYFAIAAFHWTTFVDIEPYVARLDSIVFDELDAKLLAPSHGLPIADPRRTMEDVRAGMRSIRGGRLARETGDEDPG